MDDLECSVCEIVAGVAGVRRVTPDQRLRHDVELSGDNARDIRRRVGAVRRAVPRASLRGLFPNGLTDRLERSVGLAKPRKAITVRHLVAVADGGEWFEP